MKKQRSFIQPAIIILFSFILYSNTLTHKYALDDSIVITENRFTKKGIKGIRDIFTNDSFTGFFKVKKDLVQGGRYRPLSIATFALEYQLFGEKPSVSHLINILLYALTGILIWLLLLKVLDGYPVSVFNRSLPLFTALLFVFHPIHTEAVANIKGRDETLALLLSLITLVLVIKYAEMPKFHLIVMASLCFFLALLAKENSITFLILIPVALILFQNPGIKKIGWILLFLSGAALTYIIIRINVAGGFKSSIPDELMNNPFLHATPGQKTATIIYTLGIYLKLLVVPHPLTFDYYPYHIRYQNWNPLIIFILLVYTGLLLYAAIIMFRGLRQKKTAGLLAFTLTYYLVTLFLVSNIPFNMGTFMNERFVYFPSLAYCIIIAWFIIALSVKFKKQGFFRMACLSVILLLYGYKTIDRNKAWKNNYTLFTTDVKTSENSAKSNCSAGGIIYESSLSVKDIQKKKQMLRAASAYLIKAISIHNKYADAWQLLGNVSYETGNYHHAFECYLKVLEIKPDDAITWQNTEVVLNKYDSIDKKILICEKLLQIDPDRYSINYMLGNLHGKYKGALPEAITYLTKAYHINPQSFEVCKDLGVAYGLSGELNTSIKWFARAMNLNPDDADLYFNMGITYYNLGDREKASQLIKKGEELRQKNKQ